MAFDDQIFQLFDIKDSMLLMKFYLIEFLVMHYNILHLEFVFVAALKIRDKIISILMICIQAVQLLEVIELSHQQLLYLNLQMQLFIV